MKYVWVFLLVLKLCVLIQSVRWCVSLFWDRIERSFHCLHVFMATLVSLSQDVQSRLTSELLELRESSCLWITNLQCLSFCLFAPFLWSASFWPVSPRVWRLQLSSLYLLCMFLSFSLSSFLCLTQQTGMFYTSYVSTSYNWQFYYLEYHLRGIDSLLHIISLIPTHFPHFHILLFLDFYLHLFDSMYYIFSKLSWIMGENGHLEKCFYLNENEKRALTWNRNHCQIIILFYFTF